MGDGTGARALVVDDAAEFRELVASVLRSEGFVVEVAEDGPAALRAAESFTPDVVVLDLGLPGMDGVEVCRRLRTFTDAYVAMPTARDDEVDKLIGLSVGVDDYVTKPFSPRELVARVRAMLRRPRTVAAGGAVLGGPRPVAAGAEGARQIRRVGPIEVDPDAREAKVGGRVVELTRIEF